MRHAKSRVDDNQQAIVQGLRAAGCTVQSLADIGKGCPDIIVGLRSRNFLLEIKDGSKPCPFVLPRTVCRREMTRDEAEAYIKNGKTEMMSDFISRRGRPFGASLFVKENGRHGFEFARRTGGGRKKATTKKKTTRKKTPSKKTTRKKTTRKKSAAKTARKKTTRKAGTKKSSTS